jgi:hypothetical protein
VSAESAIAPGAQGRLFSAPVPGALLRLVVVEATGSRTAPVAHVGVAAAQAHAAARATGQAWIEGTDGRTVEISVHDGALTVTPREPGWPAAIARLMADQANTAQEER